MSASGTSATVAPRIAFVVSVAIAGYFLASDAADYLLSMTAAVYGRFWSVRQLMFLHIATGSVALVVGAVQLGLALLGRTSTSHRWIGRLYVAAVTASCIAALAILRNGSVVGPIWVALLVILAGCALTSTAFGLIEARRRRWRRHVAWMLRSYMAMMVFAWFRLGWELPVMQDTPNGTRAATILGIAMLTALTATELVINATQRRMENSTRMRSSNPT
jgi:hypothetical protein